MLKGTKLKKKETRKVKVKKNTPKVNSSNDYIPNLQKIKVIKQAIGSSLDYQIVSPNESNVISVMVKEE